MNAAARPIAREPMAQPTFKMSGRPQQVQLASQSASNQMASMRPQRISMPPASGIRVIQPMASTGAQRMTSIAKGPLVPQLMVPQLAVPSGSSGSTPNVMHAPRGYVPRSYVAAAPQTSLPMSSQLPFQAKAQFVPAVKSSTLAEMKPAPKREGSPQSSVETVETVATEKEMVAEKQIGTAHAGVGLAQPAASMQRSPDDSVLSAPSTISPDEGVVASLASKEDEKGDCACCESKGAPVAETQVASEKEVKTLDAGAAKTAAVEVDAASLAVQPKQQTGCFDAILAILPCGRGQ